MELEENQQKVFNAAVEKMKNSSWFRGVCMDNFPSETECAANFEDSVSMVTMETEMWDNHEFFA